MADTYINELVSELLARLQSIEDRLSRLERAANSNEQQPVEPIVNAGVAKPHGANKAAAGILARALGDEPHVHQDAPASEAPQPVVQHEPAVIEEFTPPPSVEPVPVAATVPDSPPPELTPKPQIQISQSPSHQLPGVLREATSSVANGEAALPKDLGLETKIGSYWLNRAGLLALLIGFVSLLLYSFQYFGAGIKVAIGFALATGIIYLSRMPRFGANPWFANGLNGLGWSIAFFTTYGMYFIPDLTLISSSIIELCLLTVVSAGAMYDAVRARSEFTAGQAITFAAIAICLSPTAMNPYLGLLVLVAASSCVSIRQGWYSLLLYATAAFYAAFAYITFNTGGASQVGDLTTLINLSAAWLLIHIGVYFGKVVPDHARLNLICATLLNALIGPAFAGRIIAQLMHTTDLVGYSYAASATGLIYLFSAKLFDRKDDESLYILHQLIGLSFINIAKWSTSTLQPAVPDIIQLGLLAIVGLRYKLKALTMFAVPLAIAIVPEACSSGWQVSCLAVSVYGSIAYMYRMHFLENKDTAPGYAWLANYYFTFANIIGFYVIATVDWLTAPWRALGWTVQLIVNTQVFLRSRDSYVLSIALLMAIVSACCWVPVMVVAGNWMPIMIGMLLMYAVAWQCRDRNLKEANQWDNNTKNIYGALATVLLTSLIVKVVPVDWLALAICLEGIGVFACGLLLKEELALRGGWVLYALILFRVLIFDASHFNTAFVIASMYGFSWYCRQFDLKNEKPVAQTLCTAYGSLASVVLTACWIWNLVPTPWTSLALTAAAIIIGVVGLKVKQTWACLCSWLAIAVMAMHLSVYEFNSTLTIAVIALMYGFFCFSKQQPPEPASNQFKLGYAAAATFILTIYLLTNVPANFIAISIGIEAMALVTMGFVLKEKLLRVSGLIVFGIVALRLLFHELAAAATIIRIVSFIVTGVLLVGCSYAYGWFSKKLMAADEEKLVAEDSANSAG